MQYQFSGLTILTFLKLCATTLAVNLVVSSENGNKTSPIMYGLMFEDINHSGDGGLYAELIRNRAFQGSGSTTNPTLAAYRAVGDAVISIDTANPLSPALKNVMKVAPSSSDATQVGFLNEGFWGINVKDQEYTGSFYVKGQYNGTFIVSLKSNLTSKVYAQKKVKSTSKPDGWTKHEFVLHPEAAPNVNNTLQITFNAKGSEEGLWFSMISLFPPTYHGRCVASYCMIEVMGDTNRGLYQRKNGLRKDLAENLEQFKPTFLRFPGGNNLQVLNDPGYELYFADFFSLSEGDEPPYHWKWNETIGPLIDRPGRPGTWGYENTDGLGLVEYMEWCDDMNLEPILDVWAGYYLSGPIIPQDELEFYVQDVLNELEFLMGSIDTLYGSLRAQLGHPKPWVINYIEVGNEDDIGGGASYSAYRFPSFRDAIKAAYPHMTIIGSTPKIDPIPEGAWLDYHRYTRPDDFVSLFGMFDNWNRSHPVFVGEYAYIQPNKPGGGGPEWGGAWRSPYTTLIGMISEAVFAIGMEKNADLVRAAAYAPILQNLNSYQWSPDLISFTADPEETALSISYYLQKLFSTHHGTTVLPVTSDSKFGPLYWSASSTDNGGYYLKIANYNGTTTTVTFEVPDDNVIKGKLTTLSAPSPFSENSPKNETSIWTEKEVTKGADGKFAFELPDLTVAVLAVN
ncbi:glycoside hydrolase family 51 protein [Morchella snyderi]|nr:glycoside hydrolase family 51 protein [Morchella snyderi]